MSMPNGPQQANQQPFSNKPPYGAFNNNGGYDDQSKDYSNYNPQAQIKSSGKLPLFLPDHVFRRLL